jgi:hypothetical protein
MVGTWIQPVSADAPVFGRRAIQMTNHVGKRQLPLLPHPDHLRKQAKARLAEIKAQAPDARLADAQHGIAEEYGFNSWAALQAEVTRRTSSPLGQRIRRRRSLIAFLESQDGRGAMSPSPAPESFRPRFRPLGHSAHEISDHSPFAFLQGGMVVQISVLIATLVGIGVVCFLLKAGVPLRSGNRSQIEHVLKANLVAETSTRPVGEGQ